jgi:hypothetical protein
MALSRGVRLEQLDVSEKYDLGAFKEYELRFGNRFFEHTHARTKIYRYKGKASSLDAALAVQLHYVNLSLVVFRMHGSRYVKLQGLGLGYTEKYIASRIIRTIDSGRLLMTSLSRVSLCLRVRLVSHDIGPSTGTKVSFDRTSPPEDG